jgi:hypothetical protein
VRDTFHCWHGGSPSVRGGEFGDLYPLPTESRISEFKRQARERGSAVLARR